MSRLITLLFGVGIGAAAAHFLDPSRRDQIREQVTSKVRSGVDQATTAATHAAGKAKGAASTATPSGTRLEDPDDVTLARKVETEIFRAPDAPKGDVSVDVQHGIAHLRGEVADEQWITRLGQEAEKVEGVKGVENLLHRPGTPAPEHS
jgi:osmotically-inducible protein OsmY